MAGRTRARPHIHQDARFLPHQLQVLPVELVSDQLELLADARLHAAARGLLARRPLHPAALPSGPSRPRFLIPDELEVGREVQSESRVACGESQGRDLRFRAHTAPGDSAFEQSHRFAF